MNKTANNTGTSVPSSSFRVWMISMQDIGSINGHKTVVIISITNDKNLSAGVKLGCRSEKLNQFTKK